MAADRVPTADAEPRVTGESDPGLGRVLFGGILRKARIERKETLQQVSDRAGKSAATLSKYETGQALVELIAVRGLLRAYGVDDAAVVERAEDLIRGSASAWWNDYRTVIPAGLELLLRMEQDATQILSVSTSFVEGLFQTKPYASAVNSGTRFRPGPGELSTRRVELRMARQRLLDRDVEIVMLIDESVLRRVVGGPDVMRGQLEHLLALARRPGTTVRVLPFGSGAYPVMYANTTILESPGQQIVYGDTGLGNAYLSEPADVARIRQMFTVALDQALSPEATNEFISELVHMYEAGDQ